MRGALVECVRILTGEDGTAELRWRVSCSVLFTTINLEQTRWGRILVSAMTKKRESVPSPTLNSWEATQNAGNEDFQTPHSKGWWA
jgi:hypothetical protein